MVENQWVIVIGMGLVTILPRILPLYILDGKDLSPNIVKWMSYIPVTIFSALVFSDIFFWEDQFSLHLVENLKLIPSLIVAFVAVKADNLFVSMLTGVIAITLMFWAFG
jgi:branched-subunit amino acid transport protein